MRFIVTAAETGNNMKILAIESSCDETAAAVVEDGRKVLSSAVNSQVDEHKKYGGVVPEIASRRHAENIVDVTQKALDDANTTLQQIDAIAVTAAPGLIGALLVGVNYAKGLAMAAKKPLVPVHHIRGHIAAAYLAHRQLEPPFLCLVVSGGHSHIVEVKDYTTFNIIGRTRDDAAGECFDKSARAMGFPYPGGIYLDKASKIGDSKKYHLPKPKVEGSPYDFSFSGLKTAVINTIHNCQQKGGQIDVNSMAASFQQTICEILTERFINAAREYGYKKLAAAGGVCANSQLRAMLEQSSTANGCELYLPPVSLCGDNAAMIASQAYYELLAGKTAWYDLNASASMPIDKDIYTRIF